MIAKPSSRNIGAWVPALVVLLGAGLAAPQGRAQAPGVTPLEMSKAASAFRSLGNLATADLRNERESRPISLVALRDLGITPTNLAVFITRASPLLEEEATFKRKGAAAMCARKDELVTYALYMDALRAGFAALSEWQVQRLREFRNSLPPEDKVPPVDNLRALPPGGGGDVVDLSSIPSGLLMKMTVVEYPNQQSFQQWRLSSCPAAD